MLKTFVLSLCPMCSPNANMLFFNINHIAICMCNSLKCWFKHTQPQQFEPLNALIKKKNSCFRRPFRKGRVQGKNMVKWLKLPQIASNWSLCFWTVDAHLKLPFARLKFAVPHTLNPPLLAPSSHKLHAPNIIIMMSPTHLQSSQFQNP